MAFFIAKGEGLLKFPKTLKIGGHQFELKFPCEFRERNDLQGQFDSDQNVMRLSDRNGGGTKYCDSHIMVTFWHELLHACDETSGHKFFRKEGGEDALDGISEVLYQIFVDNPELLEVFNRKEE